MPKRLSSRLFHECREDGTFLNDFGPLPTKGKEFRRGALKGVKDESQTRVALEAQARMKSSSWTIKTRIEKWGNTTL